MLDGQVGILTYQAASYFATGENPPRLGSRHPTISPYEPVKVGANNEYIILAVGNDSLWQKFCKLVGREDLSRNPLFATNPRRVENHDALLPIVEQILAAKPKTEWLKILTEAGIPCGDIKTVKEVVSDPHVLAREMVVDLDHPKAGKIKVTGIPIKMSAYTRRRGYTAADAGTAYRGGPGEYARLLEREDRGTQGEQSGVGN